MKKITDPYGFDAAKKREKEYRLEKAEGIITLADKISPGNLGIYAKEFQPCSLHESSYPPAPRILWNGIPESTGTWQYRDRRDKLLAELYNTCQDCRELTQLSVRAAIHKEVSGTPWTYHPPNTKDFRLALLRTMFPHPIPKRLESNGHYIYLAHTQECCERAAYEGWFKQAGLSPPENTVTTNED